MPSKLKINNKKKNATNLFKTNVLSKQFTAKMYISGNAQYPSPTSFDFKIFSISININDTNPRIPVAEISPTYPLCGAISAAT